MYTCPYCQALSTHPGLCKDCEKDKPISDLFWHYGLEYMMQKKSGELK